MRERSNGWTWRWSVAGLALLVLAACSDDGNGPMDPGNNGGFNVSGTWRVTSTVVEDGCELDLEPVTVEEGVIRHEGNQITFEVEDLGDVTGTINNETGDFTIDVTLTGGGIVVMIQETGRFTSETQYTSDVTITITFPGEEPCEIRTSDSGMRIST